VIDVQHWLSALPPGVVYLIVAGVIGVESMGVPLPGEIVLVSSALLAATGVVEPEWVATAAAFGAIVGDSIGYAVGRRGGRPLLARLGRRFPKHLGPAQLARAEQSFARHGVWAVFFGRFVALLRILAGPLAGALHVPYRRFLVANAAGGLVWAFGTTYLLYSVGRAAEHWLKDISWAGLVLAVLAGLASTWWLRRRAHRLGSAAGVVSAAGVGSGADVESASGVGSAGVAPEGGLATGGRSDAVARGDESGAVGPGVDPVRVGGES
jgi:membrane protein DedA with SNARE-associated domain